MKNNTWVICADRQSLEYCAKIGTFGLNRRGSLPKMQVGDLLLAYITKESAFGGMGKVTKPYWTSADFLTKNSRVPYNNDYMVSSTQAG